jgi:hypothetical protein
MDSSRLFYVLLTVVYAGCEQSQSENGVDVIAVGTGSVNAESLSDSVPAEAPQLDLRLDSEWAVSSIFGMTVDSRGRIFVLDAAEQTVRVYAQDGSAEEPLGRKGLGPGEFVNARAVRMRGDTLWVFEPSSGRITEFATASGAVRSFTLLPRTRQRSRPIEVVANGYLALGFEPDVIGGPTPFGGTTARLRSQLVRVDERGAVQDTLTALVNSTGLRFKVRRVGSPSFPIVGGDLQREQPFFPLQLHAVAPDGASVLKLEQVQRDQGRVNFLQLTSVDLRGDTLWSKRIDFTQVPITRAHIAEMVDSLARPIQGLRGPPVEGDAQMIADSLYRGTVWPAVTAIRYGLDGTIWLMKGGPPTTGVIYWQLSPSGEVERRVELPQGFNLMQASRTTVWGWRTDEDDAPVVERYTFQR